jgi:hypothetical protein
VNFYEIKVGGPGSVLPPSPRIRLPFAFPSPLQTAHAVLQSFHLEPNADDAEVLDVAVILTTHFDPFQSTTSGEVEVELQRTGGSLLQSEAIKAEIRILVIGI